MQFGVNTHIYKVLHHFLKEMPEFFFPLYFDLRSSYSFFQSLFLLVFILKHQLQTSMRPKSTTENKSSRSNMYLWYHGSDAGFK